MNEAITRLIQCMRSENEIYTKIYEVSGTKQDVIVKGDVKGLEEITRKEKEFVSELIAAEKERSKALTQISVQMGMDAKSITVADIISKTDSPFFKKVLSELTAQLNIALQKQRAVNKTNKTLLEKNLNFIDFLMGTLTQEKENVTYSNAGGDGKPQQQVNLFDKRA